MHVVYKCQIPQQAFAPAHTSAISLHEPHFSRPTCLSSIFSHAGPPKAPVPRHCRSCSIGYGPAVRSRTVKLQLLCVIHQRLLARPGAAILASFAHTPWRIDTETVAHPSLVARIRCRCARGGLATCAVSIPVKVSTRRAALFLSERPRHLTDS